MTRWCGREVVNQIYDRTIEYESRFVSAETVNQINGGWAIRLDTDAAIGERFRACEHSSADDRSRARRFCKPGTGT
jgi:hypothetical protein